jgi:hypothetical protein
MPVMVASYVLARPLRAWVLKPSHLLLAMLYGAWCGYDFFWINCNSWPWLMVGGTAGGLIYLAASVPDE